MNRAPLAYRALLRTLPLRFRHRHAAEMESLFIEALGDCAGSFALVRTWTAGLLDLVMFSLTSRFASLTRPAASGRGLSGSRGRGPFEQWSGELRMTLRTLRKAPAFTLMALVTLGLGIGATTLVFSVVNGVLLTPLPYADSDRLVNVWNDLEEEQQFLPAISPADFRDYDRMSETFENFAAGTAGRMAGFAGVVTGDGSPARVEIAAITHDFMPLLGVSPAIGRHFEESEEVFPGPTVAMISHELWRSRFGEDPGILDRTITIDGRDFDIIGVLPRGFKLLLPDEAFLIRHADVWVPLQVNFQRLPPRNWTWLTVIGKMRPGVTLAEAQSDMDRVAAVLRENHAEHVTSGMSIRLVSFHTDIVKAVAPALWTLFGAVGFVLLIACANVAHLLLLRNSMRQREFAVRVALGASRGNIARQVMLEGAVIAGIGAALGLLLTRVGLTFLTVTNPDLPRLAELTLDGPVVLFAVGTALFTAMVFGLAPALRSTGGDLLGSLLKEGGRSGGGATANRLRNLLVVGETSMTLILLVGTGLMVRSFAAMQRVTPGYTAEGVMTFRLSLPNSEYSWGPDLIAFNRALENELLGIPGVTDVGAVSELPLTGTGVLWPYAWDEESRIENLSADGRSVSPGYFSTMEIELLSGRFFDDTDLHSEEQVVILDEMLARRAWPGEDAVGKQIVLSEDLSDSWATVVGVVRHTRIYDLTRDVREHVYVPIGARGGRTLSYAVRSDGPPQALATQIREAVWSNDPNLPINDLTPMSAYVDDALSQSRFTLWLMSGFGMLALVMAAVGIYGVVSYAVQQRKHEFGIRLALGATPGHLVRSVLIRGMVLGLASVAIGTIAAGALAQTLEAQLFEVSPVDPGTYAAVGAFLLAVTALASLIPALRSAGNAPVATLNSE